MCRVFLVVAIFLEQTGPTVLIRNLAGQIVRGLRPLVRHLEEQQIRQLLDIVAIAYTVVAEDIAVIPELFDDGKRDYEGSGCAVGGRTRMRPGSTVTIAPD